MANFTGIWVDINLIKSQKISWFEKILLSQIMLLGKGENECFASDKYFSEMFSVPISQINRAIKNLKNANFITVKNDFSAHKRIILPINETLSTYYQNDNNLLTKCQVPINETLSTYYQNDNLIYKDEIKEEIKDYNKDEIRKSEISKNEISTLTSERDFYKSEFEKLKSEQLPKKTKKQKAPQAGGAVKVEKIAHGEFQNVLLSDAEYQKLLETQGKFKLDQIIIKLSVYKALKETKYKNDYAVILKWVIKSVEEDNDKEREKNARINQQKSPFANPNTPKPPDKYQIANDNVLARVQASINQN